MIALAVAGTRPEIIKTAPVVAALRARGHTVKVAWSGQHTTLSYQMLEHFPCMAPTITTTMQRDTNSIYDLSAALLSAKRAIDAAKPDVVLVQGDTATAYFTALAAFYEGVPVAHIEAGLRSGNIREPFPEEMYRQQIDRLATYNFAPTKGALVNLDDVGVDRRNSYIVGNTVVDALYSILPKLPAGSFRSYPYILFTRHRRENLPDSRLVAVNAAIEALIEAGHTVIHPGHPNSGAATYDRPRYENTGPLPYLQTIHAIRDAACIITDSGGIQEEAAVLGVPCVVIRNQTERPEAGGVVVGTNTQRIVDAVKAALAAPLPRYDGALGTGNSGETIARLLEGALDFKHEAPTCAHACVWQPS